MPDTVMLQGASERPYRVLMIAPTSFFSDYGCHVRILEEVRYLQSQGHQAAIATYHAGRNLDGLTIFRTPSIPWRVGYEVGSSRHKIGFDLLLAGRAALCMGQWRPDIIHAHLHEGALIGLALSKAWSRPLVCDLQGGLTSEMVDHGFLRQGGVGYRCFYRLERFINRAAPHILTSTQQAAALLRDQFGCAPERVTHIPDCVNTDVFAPAIRDEAWQQRKAAMGIPPERRVIAYLGLLAEYQGTGLLLEAAAQVCRRRDDVHFLIAGFPNVSRYQEQAERLGVAARCAFPGRVPYERAPELLALGDIAVCPKISATEGAGKLLNYMAVGLPTVAFDTPTNRDYLGPDGVYATAGDSSALARAFESLLDDPARGQLLGARLRERAQQRYPWSTSGEQIVDVYRAALANHRRKRVSE